RSQERVGGGEPRWLARRTRLFCPVVAAVRDDVGKRWRLGPELEVAPQLREPDVVAFATSAVDQRVEVDERVSPRHLRGARTGRLVGVDRAKRGVRAGLRLIGGTVAEVFDIGPPRLALGGELIGERARLGGINAAASRN